MCIQTKRNRSDWYLLDNSVAKRGALVIKVVIKVVKVIDKNDQADLTIKWAPGL